MVVSHIDVISPINRSKDKIYQATTLFGNSPVGISFNYPFVDCEFDLEILKRVSHPVLLEGKDVSRFVILLRFVLEKDWKERNHIQ